MSLYAVAFSLMLAGGAIFVIATLGQLESTRLLRVSAGCSAAAVVVSVVSVLVPRRR